MVLVLFWIYGCFDIFTISMTCRKDLPLDLTEGVLRALCMQALGQVLIYSPISVGTFCAV